jgi:hypothetical protein
MVTVPHWVWTVGFVAIIGLLAVVAQQSMQAAYYRGIADDAEFRFEEQQLVLDSVVGRVDSLSRSLKRADSAAVMQRLEAEDEVARLTLSREQAQERSEAISERLRASLDSMQSVELDSIVFGYENQIESLYSIIEVERSVTAAERLRVTQASELIMGLRAVIVEHEESAAITSQQVVALRSSMQPSFGLRLKADWWMAVAGFAVGVIVTR